MSVICSCPSNYHIILLILFTLRIIRTLLILRILPILLRMCKPRRLRWVLHVCQFSLSMPCRSRAPDVLSCHCFLKSESQELNLSELCRRDNGNGCSYILLVLHILLVLLILLLLLMSLPHYVSYAYYSYYALYSYYYTCADATIAMGVCAPQALSGSTIR